MGEGRCMRCAREKCWLHHVKLQGKYQRLCSSCVMLCFGDLYCPYCLEDCGDLAGTIKCSKCPRNVHLQCESRRDNSSSSASSSSCFLCPHCLNPDFNPLSVFKINAKPNANAKAKDQGEGNSISKHMPDFVSAKLLLTAARISSVSIKRAAAAASIEASKRAREAAKLNKEAKEAVDKALAIAKEEEAKRKPPTATALPQPGRTEGFYSLTWYQSEVRSVLSSAVSYLKSDRRRHLCVEVEFCRVCCASLLLPFQVIIDMETSRRW